MIKGTSEKKVVGWFLRIIHILIFEGTFDFQMYVHKKIIYMHVHHICIHDTKQAEGR
jgi:hypothetical protein